jgi:uncharacterized Zn-binding protein involved in type VI secretion
MFRAFIREGDTTTANGIIQPPAQSSPVTLDGKNASFDGDPVYCPACKSMGITKCIPPFLPKTAPDGRQQNLDGDLCICGCRIPPKLVARFKNMGMTFDEGTAERHTASSGLLEQPAFIQKPERYDEHFIITCNRTGKPVDCFVYGIRSESGEHYDELYEDGATVTAFAQEPQKVELIDIVQTIIAI